MRVPCTSSVLWDIGWVYEGPLYQQCTLGHWVGVRGSPVPAVYTGTLLLKAEQQHGKDISKGGYWVYEGPPCTSSASVHC